MKVNACGGICVGVPLFAIEHCDVFCATTMAFAIAAQRQYLGPGRWLSGQQGDLNPDSYLRHQPTARDYQAAIKMHHGCNWEDIKLDIVFFILSLAATV